MNNTFKISIITVTYNSVQTIEETILSVINQTYPNIEYIIIDGGSSDGTVEIIKKYKKELTYWISEPDKGIYDAMNKGIGLATGEYINFMNSGDIFINTKVLSDVSEYLKTDADVLYGKTVLRNKGKFIRISTPKPFFLNKSKIKSAGFCHQSTFVKTTCLKHYGFDTNYKIAADFNLLTKIFNNRGSFQLLPFPVAAYDVKGMSSINRKERELELISICKVDIDSPLVYIYMFKQLIKRCVKLLLYNSEI